MSMPLDLQSCESAAGIQGIRKTPILYFGEDTTSNRKPRKKHHRLYDKTPLLISELKVSRIMAQKVTEHIQHQGHRRDHI